MDTIHNLIDTLSTQLTPPTVSTTPEHGIHGLVDTILVDVRNALASILSSVATISAKIPVYTPILFRNILTILVACAVIAAVGVAITFLFALFFVYPRPATLSNKSPWEDYMDHTYMPHFLALRAGLNSDASTLSRLGLPVLFPIANMNAVLPKGDTDCVDFLKKYFNCFSAYSDHTVLFGKPLFLPPERAQDRLGYPQEWGQMEEFRKGVSTAATLQTTCLWLSESAYNGLVVCDLQKQLLAQNYTYESYLETAQVVARISAASLEMNLMLNTYLPDIVMRYDSRQRRLYGNPFIWVYYMKDTSIDTALKINRLGMRTLVQMCNPSVITFRPHGCLGGQY